MGQRPVQVRAKQAHRRLAAFLGLFIGMHFAAHFAALESQQLQALVLDAGRTVYRIPLIEIALVAGFAAQVALGLLLLRGIGRRKRKDRWHYAQYISGAYLAYFIVMHTAAALLSRWLAGLDTNFYWPAGTLILSPLKYGFMPYYVLAVIALVTHLVAAMHFRRPRPWQAPVLVSGPLAAFLIIVSYSGMLYRVELPPRYLEYFGQYLSISQ